MKRKTRIISMLLCIVMVLGLLPTQVFAVDIVASGYCGGEGDGTNLSWTLDSEGVLTISGTGAMADYGNYWNQNLAPWGDHRTEIKKLILGAGITHIGNNAFHIVENLTGTLELPESVVSIGTNAFRACAFTGSLMLPDNTETIRGWAFCDCSHLDGTLTLGKNLSKVDDTAFEDTNFAKMDIGSCTSTALIRKLISNFRDTLDEISVDPANPNYLLQDDILYNRAITEIVFCSRSKTGTLEIPYGVEKISDYAFFRCADLTGELIFPDTLSHIGDTAFCKCTGFTGDLRFPDTVSYIGPSAFSECAGFDGQLFLPKGVTLGERVFNYCQGLRGSIVIPEGVSGVPANAFFECSGFDGSIILGSDVKAIGQFAFKCCDNVTGSLDIPAGVTQIGTCAFEYCDALNGSAFLPVDFYVASWAFKCGIKNFYFRGNAPTGNGLRKYTFPDDATLYYLENTSGWTDSEAYDATAGTWNGYKLATWDEGGGDNPSQGDYGNTVSITRVGGPNRPFSAEVSILIDGNYSLGDGYIALYRYDNNELIERIDTKSFMTIDSVDPEDYVTKNIISHEDGATFVKAVFQQLPANSCVYPVISDTFLKDQTTGKCLRAYTNKEKTHLYTPIDRWFFLNNDEAFTNKYVFIESDLEKIDENLSFLEVYNIKKNILKENWDGSCYGMSVTTLLNAYSLIQPDLFYGNVDSLYKIPKYKGDYVEGKINYYHALQYNNAYVKAKKEFMKLDNREQLQIIDSLGEKANRGDGPFLLSFSGKLKKDKISVPFGHAVVGMGKETGSWTQCIPFLKKPVEFTSRIKLYDCSLNYNDPTYMYYDCGTGAWWFDGWMHNATTLQCATNDMSLLDPIDHRKGRSANLSSAAFLTVESQDGSFDFDLFLDGQTYHVTPSTDLRDIGLISFFDSSVAYENGEIIPPDHMNVFIPDQASSYIITPRINSSGAFSVFDQDIGMSAQVASCDSLAFDKTGHIFAAGINGEYTFEILYNDGYCDYPWNQTTIAGDGISNIEIKKADDGIAISSDCPAKMTVTVRKDSEEKIIQFSKEDSDVLVTERITEDGIEPIIMADKDNDGTYDTPVTSGFTYSVTFNCCGGVISQSSSKTNSEGKVSEFPTPTRDGYTFVGWFTAADGGTQITTETVFTEDTTVYAHWTENADVPDTPVPPYIPPVVPVQPTQPDTPAVPGIPVPSYTDVSPDAWYYSAVLYVSGRGLMTGTGANTFAPDAAASRAMMWTILARMSGAEVDGGKPWYVLAQTWATVNGMSDGTDPDGRITREQLVTMLYRYAGEPEVADGELAGLNTFADSADVSEYARKAMAWAVSNGIINGIGGRLVPQGTVARAQVAAMLMRFCENVLNK